MENNNLENNNDIQENVLVFRKKGRPPLIVGETAKTRNKDKMKELRDTGYFKNYYQNRKTKVKCSICDTETNDIGLKQHLRSQFCQSVKYLNSKNVPFPDPDVIQDPPIDVIQDILIQPKPKFSLIREFIINYKEYELIENSE